MSEKTKLLPVGISDFKTIRNQGYYLVDKSLFIQDLLNGGPQVTLITRPRRFGKTLNMSMIKAFFEISKEDTRKYFKDLAISNTPCMREQGKYPVIFMTLKDIKCQNWNDTLALLQDIIQEEYNRFHFIWESDILTAFDKAYVQRILNHTGRIADWQVSLKKLTRYLQQYYGIPPILLVDEYDIPIQQGYMSGFYDDVISFMRNWLSAGLKDNENLKFSVLTGILHIAQESIFSGLNNLSVCTVLDVQYRQYFGFTQNEIEEIVKCYHCADKISELQEWYDGYNFGGLEIYNPWSIIKYLHSDCRPAPYWLFTSSNDLIYQLLEIATDDIKETLKKLLDGGDFTTGLNTQIVYPKVFDNASNIFSFLVMTGYLRAERKDYPDGYCDYNLRIPNREIANVYKEEIILLAEESGAGSAHYTIEFRKALFEGNIQQLDKLLCKIIQLSISYYDAQENFYHGWMLALTGIFFDTHYIYSNREAGYGRYDILMEPKKNHFPAIIFELKVLSSNHADQNRIPEQLQELAAKALEQIETKQYDADLKNRKITNILKYGIGFYQKDLCILKKE